MTEKITKRQQAVLDVIEQCIREKGFGPTVREVCQALGLSSPSTVHVHLKALEEKGLIKRDAMKSRSIALTYPLDHTEDATNIIQGQFDDIDSVPLVGDVAAGVRAKHHQHHVAAYRNRWRCPIFYVVRAWRKHD